MPKDTNCPHDAATFVARIHALLPEGTEGRILIGAQHGPEGTFTFHEYDGTVPGDATHINAAVFRAGVTSNAQSGAVGTLGLVLDDVGDAAKAPNTPDLTPTARIETSAGNEQWLFLYAHPVASRDGHGMARAAEMAGLSDPFISKQNQHWWRLPGSLPEQKILQGRTELARLIEFSGVTYGYDEMAQKLGIDPDAIDTTAYDGSTKFDADTAIQDPVWKWLCAEGHVKPSNWRQFDARGFSDVLCPNHEAHTDRNRPWGRYVPPNAAAPNGGFICHHAHCSGVGGKKLTLGDFRRWVEKEGGPPVSVAQDYTRKLKFNPTPEQIAKAKRAVARLEARRGAERATEAADGGEVGPDPQHRLAPLFGAAWGSPTDEQVKTIEEVAENDPGGLVAYARGVKREANPKAIFTDPEAAAIEAELMAKVEQNTELESVIDVFSAGDTPRFPMRALPEALASDITRFAQATKMDPDALAAFSLAAVAAAAGSKTELLVGGSYTEPMILWMAGTGPVSAKKSPTINAVMATIRATEKNGAQSRKTQLAAVEAEQHKSGADKKRALDKVPYPRRFISVDGTLEKLGGILARPDQHGHGMVVMRDELTGWLGQMDRYAANGGGADRAHWLSAYNGETVTIDRVARGELYVDRFALGLVGGIQDEKLKQLGKGGRLTDDGLLQRFFFVPMHRTGSMQAQRTAPPEITALRKILQALLSERFSKQWTLSDEAMEIANEFFESVDALALDPDIDAAFAGWLSKAQKFYCRLALALQLMDPNPGFEVGARAARGAADLMMGYFIRTAEAAMELVSTGDSQSEIMQRIARWLLRLDAEAGDRPAVFSSRDAMRNGPRNALRKVEPALIEVRLGKMAAFGWLEIIPPEGNERSPRYKVTKGIAGRFSGELERLYAVRRRIAETSDLLK